MFSGEALRLNATTVPHQIRAAHTRPERVCAEQVYPGAHKAYRAADCAYSTTALFSRQDSRLHTGQEQASILYTSSRVTDRAPIILA